MRIRKYPPEIKGNTISNLILVDSYDYDKKRKEWYEDKNCYGYTDPFNSRDIFLNVNRDDTRSNTIHKDYVNIIIHEVTHNILTKFIGEQASRELDNLFYKRVYRRKLKRLLFGIHEPTLREQKIVKNRKKYRGKRVYKNLDSDFWLKVFQNETK